MPIDFPVTPNAMKTVRKLVKDARKDYVTARRACLDAKALAHATGTRNLLAREDAAAEAMHARHWLYEALRRLARAEAAGVEKGANISPAAKARAIASGRWKAD